MLPKLADGFDGHPEDEENQDELRQPLKKLRFATTRFGFHKRHLRHAPLKGDLLDVTDRQYF